MLLPQILRAENGDAGKFVIRDLLNTLDLEHQTMLSVFFSVLRDTVSRISQQKDGEVLISQSMFGVYEAAR